MIDGGTVLIVNKYAKLVQSKQKGRDKTNYCISETGRNFLYFGRRKNLICLVCAQKMFARVL